MNWQITVLNSSNYSGFFSFLLQYDIFLRGERAAETMGSNLSTVWVFIHWFGWGGLRWRGLCPFFNQSLQRRAVPDVLLIHCGGNDLGNIASVKIGEAVKVDLHHLHVQYPGMRIIFSGITQRCRWKAGANPAKINKAHKFVNSVMATYVHGLNGSFIHHPAIRFDTPGLFLHDGVHFTTQGNDVLLNSFAEFIKAQLQQQ